MARRIAVVHDPRSFFPLDLRAGFGDAAEILWVLPDGRFDSIAERVVARFGPTVRIAPEDPGAAAAAVAAHAPQGIVTFVDDHLVLTAEIAARLGLPFHTVEVARTLQDKRLQRQALRQAGVPGPDFITLDPGLDPRAVADLTDGLSYPAVYKPARGSGSRGLLALSGPSDLIAAYEPASGAVVEAFLPDDSCGDPRFASYLSVESAVSAGQVSHLALTGRFPLAEPFRETGNFTPVPIGDDLRRELVALTDAAIAALGIRTAMLHTEIKLTPAGPMLIEVNGRLGGRPPYVLQRAANVNLFRMACAVAFGERCATAEFVPCHGVAYYRMLQAPCWAGRVSAVHGVGALTGPHVDSVALNRAPGAAVDWREGTDGKVLTISGWVPDHVTLAQVIDWIDRTVKFEFDPCPDGDGAPEPARVSVSDAIRQGT